MTIGANHTKYTDLHTPDLEAFEPDAVRCRFDAAHDASPDPDNCIRQAHATHEEPLDSSVESPR